MCCIFQHIYLPLILGVCCSSISVLVGDIISAIGILYDAPRLCLSVRVGKRSRPASCVCSVRSCRCLLSIRRRIDLIREGLSRERRCIGRHRLSSKWLRWSGGGWYSDTSCARGRLYISYRWSIWRCRLCCSCRSDSRLGIVYLSSRCRVPKSVRVYSCGCVRIWKCHTIKGLSN